jgi:hypothetical protein
MRKELKIGISLLVIFSILNVIVNAPELLKGFLVGLGFCFIIIGTLPEKTYLRLKNRKKSAT